MAARPTRFDLSEDGILQSDTSDISLSDYEAQQPVPTKKFRGAGKVYNEHSKYSSSAAATSAKKRPGRRLMGKAMGEHDRRGIKNNLHMLASRRKISMPSPIARPF